MNKIQYEKFRSIFYPSIIIFAAALIRVLPHLPNVTPIGAMALFGGATLPKRYAFTICFLAMFLSDLFLSFHMTMIFVYLSFGLIIITGTFVKRNISVGKIIAASIVSSIIFFLTTNFGVWFLYDFYSKNLNGLIDSYIAGIPFFRYTLAGDLSYASVFFGSFALVKKYLFEKAVVRQK